MLQVAMERRIRVVGGGDGERPVFEVDHEDGERVADQDVVSAVAGPCEDASGLDLDA